MADNYVELPPEDTTPVETPPVEETTSSVEPPLRPPEEEAPPPEEAPVQDEEYYRTHFNTKLTPEEEAGYQDYLKQLSALKHRDVSLDENDYDVRGQYKEFGPVMPENPEQHGTDRYKKPNHPTFSEESIYNGTPNPAGGTYQGGKWGENTFTPSKEMVEERGFPRIEHDVSVNTKGKARAVNPNDPSSAAAAAMYTASDPLLLDSVEMQESGGGKNLFGPVLRDGTRALGPYQFLESTFKEWAEPGANIMTREGSRPAAEKYLSYLQNHYNGDISLALAAYNHGPGNVDKELDRAEARGLPRTYLSVLSDPHFPLETRKYVTEVLGRYSVSLGKKKEGTYSQLGQSVINAYQAKYAEQPLSPDAMRPLHTGSSQEFAQAFYDNVVNKPEFDVMPYNDRMKSLEELYGSQPWDNSVHPLIKKMVDSLNEGAPASDLPNIPQLVAKVAGQPNIQDGDPHPQQTLDLWKKSVNQSLYQAGLPPELLGTRLDDYVNAAATNEMDAFTARSRGTLGTVLNRGANFTRDVAKGTMGAYAQALAGISRFGVGAFAPKFGEGFAQALEETPEIFGTPARDYLYVTDERGQMVLDAKGRPIPREYASTGQLLGQITGFILGGEVLKTAGYGAKAMMTAMGGMNTLTTMQGAYHEALAENGNHTQAMESAYMAAPLGAATSLSGFAIASGASPLIGGLSRAQQARVLAPWLLKNAALQGLTMGAQQAGQSAIVGAELNRDVQSWTKLKDAMIAGAAGATLAELPKIYANRNARPTFNPPTPPLPEGAVNEAGQLGLPAPERPIGLPAPEQPTGLEGPPERKLLPGYREVAGPESTEAIPVYPKLSDAEAENVGRKLDEFRLSDESAIVLRPDQAQTLPPTLLSKFYLEPVPSRGTIQLNKESDYTATAHGATVEELTNQIDDLTDKIKNRPWTQDRPTVVRRLKGAVQSYHKTLDYVGRAYGPLIDETRPQYDAYQEAQKAYESSAPDRRRYAAKARDEALAAYKEATARTGLDKLEDEVLNGLYRQQSEVMRLTGQLRLIDSPEPLDNNNSQMQKDLWEKIALRKQLMEEEKLAQIKSVQESNATLTAEREQALADAGLSGVPLTTHFADGMNVDGYTVVRTGNRHYVYDPSNEPVGAGYETGYAAMDAIQDHKSFLESQARKETGFVMREDVGRTTELSPEESTRVAERARVEGWRNKGEQIRQEEYDWQVKHDRYMAEKNARTAKRLAREATEKAAAKAAKKQKSKQSLMDQGMNEPMAEGLGTLWEEQSQNRVDELANEHVRLGNLIGDRFKPVPEDFREKWLQHIDDAIASSKARGDMDTMRIWENRRTKWLQHQEEYKANPGLANRINTLYERRRAVKNELEKFRTGQVPVEPQGPHEDLRGAPIGEETRESKVPITEWGSASRRRIHKPQKPLTESYTGLKKFDQTGEKQVKATSVFRDAQDLADSLAHETQTFQGGAIPKGLAGFVNFVKNYTKVGRPGDVGTLFHEVLGHVVDRALIGRWDFNGIGDYSKLPEKVKRAFIDQSETFYGRPLDTVNKQIQEGFASFMEHYMTGQPVRKEALAWFDSTFAADHPEVYRAIQKLKQKAFEYYNQTPEKSVMSRLEKPESDIKKGIGALLSKDWWYDKWHSYYHVLPEIQGGYTSMLSTNPALKQYFEEHPGLTEQFEADRGRAVEMMHNLVYGNITDLWGNELPDAHNLKEILSRVSGKEEELVSYLVAKSAAASAKRGIDVGEPMDDVKAVIDNIENNHPDVVETAQQYWDWTQHARNLISEASNSGKTLIDHMEEENMKLFGNRHGYWVPFRRAGTGKVISSFGRKGSTRPKINPLYEIQGALQNMIGRSLNARTQETIAFLAGPESGPTGIGRFVREVTGGERIGLAKEFAERTKNLFGPEATERNEVMDGMTAMLMPEFDGPSGPDFKTYAIYDGNKVRFFEMDPRVVKTFHPVFPDFVNSLWFRALFRTPANVLRPMATGLRAAFQVKNAIRDQETAWRYIQSMGLAGTGMDTAALAGYTLSAAQELALRAVGTEQKGWANRAINLGLAGATRLGSEFSLVREVKGTKLGSAVSLAGATMHRLEAFISTPELATRTAVMRMAAKRLGITDPNQKLTPAQAYELITAFKRGTTNFQRQGEYARVINMAVPFFTARIAEITRLPEDFRRNPGKMIALGGAMLTAGIYHALAHNDESWYKENEMNQKMQNMLFKINVNGVDKEAYIPLDSFSSHFWGIGQAIGNSMMQDPNLKPGLVEMAKAYVSGVMPVSNVADLGGVLLREVYSQATNKDPYFGNYIVPPSLQYQDPRLQYNEMTTELAKTVSDLTGVLPAGYQLSPLRIDHAIRSAAPAAMDFLQFSDRALGYKKAKENQSMNFFANALTRSGSADSIMDRSQRLFTENLVAFRMNKPVESMQEEQVRKKLEKINQNVSDLKLVLYGSDDQEVRDSMREAIKYQLDLGLGLVGGTTTASVTTVPQHSQAKAQRKQKSLLQKEDLATKQKTLSSPYTLLGGTGSSE